MPEQQIPIYMGPTQKTIDMLKWVNRTHLMSILPTEFNKKCITSTNQYINGSVNLFSIVLPYVSMQLSDAEKLFSREFSDDLSMSELNIKSSLEKSSRILSSENVKKYWPNALPAKEVVHSYHGYIDELANSLSHGAQNFPECDSLKRYLDGYNTLVKEIDKHWEGFYIFEVPKSE